MLYLDQYYCWLKILSEDHSLSSDSAFVQNMFAAIA